MKKILLSALALGLATISNAQIPTTGLIFRHSFTNTLAANVPTGISTNFNSGSLATNEFGAANNAFGCTSGQYMEFNNVNYNLRPGIALTLSAKVKLDTAYIKSLPGNTYINIVNNGDCFIRILKTPVTYYMQMGLNNNSTQSGSFGYFVSQFFLPTLDDQWRTYTFTYIGSSTGNEKNVTYVNGIEETDGFKDIACSATGLTSYQSNSFIIGTKPANQLFQGSIDEVLLYDRNLSAAEVLSVHNNLTTGLNKLNDDAYQYQLYPNPTNGILNMELENISDASSIIMTNALGEVVLSQKLVSNNTNINTSQLSSGIYFVSINGVTKKIIKE